MTEIKQWVYNIHLIFKESEIAGRIALALILSKSVYNAKKIEYCLKN